MTNRGQQIDRLRDCNDRYDVVVIGGGAMGLGVAVESIGQGFRTALVEQHDFAHGTSSRSTKLIHGGIRYLAQRDFGLVREALHERKRLCERYSDVVHPLSFVIPTYSRREQMYYRAGTWLYDRLAGRMNLAASRSLDRSQTLLDLPYVKSQGLRGGVKYSDAQFDDARLALRLAQRIWANNGVAVNYTKVVEVMQHGERVVGVTVEDLESGQQFVVGAKVVVNATGVAADRLRRMANPQAKQRLRFSQGTHLVIDAQAECANALLVPETPDGRVVFVIPWLGKLLIGTTDVEISDPSFHPIPTMAEIDYLLELAGRYLQQTPRVSDVRSVFAGHRALVLREPGSMTHQLSRSHVVEEDPLGMIHVLGGKWTTFAAVARDVVHRVRQSGVIPANHGRPLNGDPDTGLVASCESSASEIDDLLDPRLSIRRSDIARAASCEMARSVADVLARRTRCLFLDARAASDVAPRVATCLAGLLGHNLEWQESQTREFQELAQQYQVSGGESLGR